MTEAMQLDFDSAQSVCALVASDPKNQRDVDAVVEAVRKAAQDGPVDANSIRLHLPGWVQPQCIGAAISGLRARGVLQPAGWTENTDKAGRNAGKPLRRYTVNVGAL